jgi:glutamine amidotransferase
MFWCCPGWARSNPRWQTLRARGLVDVLAELVLVKRKPILGICLGMQLMAEDSEENGHHVGLGWIPGHVRRLRVPSAYSVPQVGWNDVQLLQRDPLFNRTGDAPNFYFDHSYHFVCEPAFQAAVCDYAGPGHGRRATRQRLRCSVSSRREPGQRVEASARLLRRGGGLRRCSNAESRPR